MTDMRMQILNMLEKNSRIDLKDAAVMLGTDEVSLANEIADMEKEGIICGYHTLINWDNTTEEKVTALIAVTVTPQRGSGFDRMADYICQYDEVNAVYLMSGTYDFTVIIEGRSLKDIAFFVSDKLSTIEGVIQTATHFVLKKYKYHGTRMAAGNSDERMIMTP